MTRITTILFSLLLMTTLSGCGYNALNAGDEAVTAAWSEVVNQYKRRADLIPNLVRTVEGFAQQEREVLVGVTEARSKVNNINVTAETLEDPAALRHERLPDAGPFFASDRNILEVGVGTRQSAGGRHRLVE